MSRSNLLLSLLANNPNSRSNSLANKEGLSPTMSFFPRSTSNSLQKVEKKERNKMHTSSQLIKLVHMLNVKMKQSYYFAFCKLQQIYLSKKSKMDLCKTQHTIQPKNNPSLLIDKSQAQRVEVVDNQVQNTPMAVILDKVSDWHSAFITKIKAKSDNITLRESLNKILRASQCNHSLYKIQAVFKKHSFLILKDFFNKCFSLQNAKIKIQILVDTLNQTTHKIMFYSLRNIQIATLKVNNQQNQSASSLSRFSQSKTEPNCIQTSIFETSLLTDRPKKQSIQANAQKVPRCMKIKIKEKYTTISKSIKLQCFVKINKAFRINLKQPSKILLNQRIFEDTKQPRNILINLHHQHFNNPLPDFADNCSIFRNLPDHLQELFLQRNTLITEPFLLEHRKSVQMLPTEDGSLTERTKPGELLGEQKYNKSISFKHNSLGKLRSKKVINISQSPLKKVEELYKTVQQFNSITASNKQKKLININLPNFLNSQHDKIRASRTPLKEQYEQAHIIYSKGKQNTINRQRLITERDKQKMQKGGLQESATKYKSSMLTRERKVKADKIQLSTARKMKMEIQNIISRRNKQLGRNQLYQLK